MPLQIVMMSAIAAVTSRIRLLATATLTPLRHPLENAKQWASLDLLSQGRVTITPIGGWQREEYEAFGIPFAERGRRLDEQLEIMHLAWRETPISYAGEFYRFDDVYVMPKPVQPGGPEILIGGDRMSGRVIARIVRWGSGYTLTSAPTAEQLARLAAAMRAAGRDPESLQTNGLVLPFFPDARSRADLAATLDASVPPLIEAGVDSITIKPSQYIDDPDELPGFLREVDRRVSALV
jgi:probable F420-dependent oxidoreductase